jgi:hypothetical protein
MNRENKISIKEAARLMGVSQMLLRLMIRENKLDSKIAFCVKNKGRYYYYINRKLFLEYLCIK